MFIDSNLNKELNPNSLGWINSLNLIILRIVLFDIYELLERIEAVYSKCLVTHINEKIKEIVHSNKIFHNDGKKYDIIYNSYSPSRLTSIRFHDNFFCTYKI